MQKETGAAAFVRRLPLVFEQNAGQAPEGVRWILTRPSGVVWFLDDGVTFHPRRRPRTGENAAAVHMRLSGRVRPAVQTPLTAAGRLATRGGWRDITLASTIAYEDIHPGITLRFYDCGGILRYDLELGPNADLSRFGFAFEGASVDVEHDGTLNARFPEVGVRHSRPRCFAAQGSIRTEIPGSFVRRPDASVGFRVDHTAKGGLIVIDPELIFGSYLDEQLEHPMPLMDASGQFCDIAFGPRILTAPDDTTQLQIRRYDCTDPSSPQLVYVVLLRAFRIMDLASAGQHLFVAANRVSDVAVPSDAIEAMGTQQGLRAMILRLDADGSVSRATHFRFPLDRLAVDPADPGSVYLSGGYAGGYIAGSPYTALRTPMSYDAIVAKFDADLRSVSYFTSIGPAGPEFASTHVSHLSVRSEFVVAAGTTNARQFATPGAFSEGQPPFPSLQHARRLFVSKLDANGGLVFAAAMGSGDSYSSPLGLGILTDDSIVFGRWHAPVSEGPPIPATKKIHRIAGDGTAQLSEGPLNAEAVAIITEEASANIWFCGDTLYTGLATPDAAQTQVAGHRDAFVGRATLAGTVSYFTYLGGTRYDAIYHLAHARGQLYALGQTESPDLIPGSAFQNTYGGQTDLFLAIFAERPPVVTVVKTDNPSGVLLVNQSFEYRIAITNPGAASLAGLVVDDVAPPADAIAIFPVAPWQQQGNRIFTEGLTLAPGETRTLNLEAIVLREGCFTNEAVVSRAAVQLGRSTVETCAGVGAAAQIMLTLSDDSGVFASNSDANAVTIVTAVRNLSATQPAVNLRLTHTGAYPLRFERLRPAALVMLSSDPPATRDATGDLSAFVRAYDLRIDRIEPGATLHVFTTTVRVKTGAYTSNVEVREEGSDNVLQSISRTFTMGPVADVLLQLSIVHMPPSGPGNLQRFDIEIDRTSADPGEPMRAVGLHVSLTVPAGTPVPPDGIGYSPSLTLATGEHGTTLRRVSQDGAWDTWVASFVVREVPEIARIHLPADVTVTAAAAYVEGALRTLPAEAVWP